LTVRADCFSTVSGQCGSGSVSIMLRCRSRVEMNMGTVVLIAAWLVRREQRRSPRFGVTYPNVH